ncbi:MAG TPA: dynamin family protein [Candidatus Limnocylindria bacterium]|nr:dynamin family protein [Candidatus Limnocylindria bacterium]
MRNGPARLRGEVTTGAAPLPEPTAIAGVIAAVGELARAHGRDDLMHRLEQVAQRVARTETIVCVVGEFKKGKSALINALLESPVCPVDDDFATMTVTVVRYAAEPTASARRREGGKLIVEAIGASDLDRWVAERDGDDRPHGVELVEVGLPNAFLERGVALVDTPGVGGLNAAHAAATLAFLPTADALVFVTDASAELSGPELAFLETARKAGLPILIAITKVDIYPQWRRIVALDEKHLRAMGVDDEPFAVSSVLRAAGRRLADPSLDEESGFPRFAEALIEDAVGRAREASRSVAVAQILQVIDQLREPLAAESMALERPETAEQLARDLRDVRDRLTSLAGTDASWSVRLEDEFAALRTRTEFAFQTRMRQLQRDTQEEIERIDPARSWPDVSQRVQQDTAAAVRASFLQVTDGAADVQAQIADLLAIEAIGLDGAGAAVSFDVSTLWRGGPAFEGRAKSGIAAGLVLLGGAQVGTVGVEMLGMLGTLLGTVVAGPVFLGVAAVLGGKQVIDERRRLLADRRQQARSFLSEFLAEVRFEADGRLALLLGEVQRQIRAGFTERIRELRRTYAETTEALERATEQAETEQRARLTSVQAKLRHIEELRDRAIALELEPV